MNDDRYQLAEIAGRVARLAGGTRAGNPHAPDSLLGNCWLLGFDQAEGLTERETVSRETVSQPTRKKTGGRDGVAGPRIEWSDRERGFLDLVRAEPGFPRSLAAKILGRSYLAIRVELSRLRGKREGSNT